MLCENDLALAVIDLRQFHPGHALVIPRQHLHDVRELDDTTGAALMAMLPSNTDRSTLDSYAAILRSHLD